MASFVLCGCLRQIKKENVATFGILSCCSIVGSEQRLYVVVAVSTDGKLVKAAAAIEPDKGHNVTYITIDV